AWNKDAVLAVIGIESGPRGRRVRGGFRGGYGGQVGDAGSGDDREDPSGVFRPEQADQDDFPRASGVAEGRAFRGCSRVGADRPAARRYHPSSRRPRQTDRAVGAAGGAPDQADRPPYFTIAKMN